MFDKRSLVRTAALLLLLPLTACSSTAVSAPGATPDAVAQADNSLILLGTAGGPGAMTDRSGIASLLDVGGTLYLIDAGDGVTRQLVRAGYSEPDVKIVFLTHLHDDHTAGLPALASFRWTLRAEPLQILGPPKTEELVAGLLAFLKPNADIRMQERRLPLPSQTITGRDLPIGLAYSDEQVRVFALENTHFHLEPGGTGDGHKSYSYRFELPGRTIVFTGDTGPSDALTAFAAGADILVAEMVSPADIAQVPPDVVKHMLDEHLSTETLGQLAQAAGVRKVVISHNRAATEQDVQAVKLHFSGDVVLGRDLDRF
jgi:ribonuclease BN (tRNA processing enzyme)